MIAALLKGLALGILLALSVGPVIFTIIKLSLNKGHRAGYFFVGGVSASDITLVILCNFFTAVFAVFLKHEMIIATVGSFFLLILGIYNVFFKKNKSGEPIDNDEKNERSYKKHELAGLFFSGFAMNSFNPGALLFWFAWSAAILASSKNEPHPISYRCIVFGTCLLFVLSTDIAKVLLASKLRSKLTPKNMHRIDQISGLILIGFGIALLWGIFLNLPK
jgi:threonine/homoserine/homoserine lactone efflux protein